MRPVKMPEHNADLGEPTGWDAAKDGPCRTITAHIDSQARTITTAWELTQDELAKMLNGGKLRVRVFGGLPPMSIWVE